MVRRRAVTTWIVTLALVGGSAGALLAVLRTGAPPAYVGAGVAGLAYLAFQSWRSGGRFEADAYQGRPLSGRDPPEIRRALLEVCEATGRPLPALVVVRMDVPGVVVGYTGGRSLIAVDTRLLWIVGPRGLRALFAHELGHLETDIHTDAIRAYLPQILGFAAFWLVALAGRGPAVATAGSLLYLALAPVGGTRALAVRGVLSLGVEPAALAVSRYANRQEEYLADAYAAGVVSPALLTDALYHVAAMATGDNDEDVAGPVPWEADRTLPFSLFATHPSIERRAEALGCDLPAWVRPYRPRRRDAPEPKRGATTPRYSPVRPEGSAMGEGDTLVNAVIGAVVTVVLSFTTISPVLGGGVAGYLQRGTRAEGVRVGAISGAIAVLPFLLLFLLFGGFVLPGAMMGEMGVPGGFVVFLAVALVLALAWTVGLSALGGYLGVYLATETDIGS